MVTRDASGRDQLELSGGPPAQGGSSVVMMAWEQPYMEALVEALDVSEEDAVLEVGYGLGFSAAAIRRARPRRHVVVECDATVARRAREALPDATVAEATWQDALAAAAPDGAPYTSVFFDDFPIVAAPALQQYDDVQFACS